MLSPSSLPPERAILRPHTGSGLLWPPCLRGTLERQHQEVNDGV